MGVVITQTWSSVRMYLFPPFPLIHHAVVKNQTGGGHRNDSANPLVATAAVVYNPASNVSGQSETACHLRYSDVSQWVDPSPSRGNVKTDNMEKSYITKGS